MKIDQAPKHVQELFARAVESRSRSYSPYSGCKVGAALVTTSGKVYGGCNVENSSYGGAVCAERTAVFKAVSEEGKISIREIVVVTDATPAWPPCGICRQILAEFAVPDMPIHAANLAGEYTTQKFSELFPSAFTPAHLGK